MNELGSAENVSQKKLSQSFPHDQTDTEFGDLVLRVTVWPPAGVCTPDLQGGFPG